MDKLPKKVLIKLDKNEVYPIAHLFFKTQQVTLIEKNNVWNTVDFKDVEFLED